MNLFVFTACILASTVVLLLLRFGIRAQRANVWLAVYVVSQTACLLTAEILSTDLVLQMPHFIRVGNFFAYLWMPALYLYVKNTFYPGKPLKGLQLLIFLPALIYVVDYLPFFLLSGDQKLALFEQSTLRNKYRILEINGWLLNATVHYIARAFISMFFLGKSIWMIWRNRRFDLEANTSTNLPVYQFILLQTIFSAPFVLLLIVRILLGDFFNWDIPYKLGLGMPSIITPIFLLLFPQVLYGFVQAVSSNKPGSVPAGAQQTNAASILSKIQSPLSDGVELVKSHPISAGQKTHLIEYMEVNAPYLEKGLSIHSLSEKSGMPVYVISQIVNQAFGMPFNQWINGYRVRHFIKLLEEDQNKTMTLEFLGMSSGFKNRATFIAAVKKETGHTPGAYLKATNGNDMPHLCKE